MIDKQIKDCKEFVDTGNKYNSTVIYFGVEVIIVSEITSFKYTHSLSIDVDDKECTLIPSKNRKGYYMDDTHFPDKKLITIPTFAKEYQDKARITIESIFEGFGER